MQRECEAKRQNLLMLKFTELLIPPLGLLEKLLPGDSQPVFLYLWEGIYSFLYLRERVSKVCFQTLALCPFLSASNSDSSEICRREHWPFVPPAPPLKGLFCLPDSELAL